jgi:hypothetical protein
MPDTTIAAIHAQRAEVAALLAFKHAEPGEEENLAWWRLQQVRVARRALLPPAQHASLLPLPPPPAAALSWWQGVKQRLGRLKPEEEAPPRGIARKLGPHHPGGAGQDQPSR